MQNKDLRKKIKESNLTHWRIAKCLGISEFTLSRWFREELTAEKKELIEKAIETLKARDANG